MLDAEITATGDVLVEGQHVGSLQGFRFLPDPSADGPDGKALRAAAQKALAGEYSTRAKKVASANNDDLILSIDGTLRWQGIAIARLVEGSDALRPRLILLADDTLASSDRERIQARVDLWLTNRTETLLKPLFDLAAADQLTPPARGIAFRLVENYGAIDRAAIADEVRALDQEARAGMRALGVRFGAYNIYVPALLKPAPSTLLATLWALKNGGVDQPGVADLAGLAASGRTSLPVDATIPAPLYRIVGYSIAGTRAVRIDILERLADLIRPLIAWRTSPDGAPPPEGAAPGNGFTVTVGMTSLLGCSGEDFCSVLRGLGYRMEQRPAPPVAAPEPATDTALAGDGNGAAETEAAPTALGDNSAGPDGLHARPDRGTDPPTPEEGEAQPSLDGEARQAEPAADAIAEIAAPVGNAASEEAAAPEEPAAAAENASDAHKASDGTAEAEPAFIEIWRPGRRDRPRPPRDRSKTATQATQHRQAARAPSASGEPADKERKRPQRPRKRKFDAPHQPPPTRKARVEKRADPDSPFAALAALKAQLEGKDEGR